MRTYPECLPCFLRQVLDVARMMYDDEEEIMKIMHETLDNLKSLDMEKSPIENTRVAHRSIRIRSHDPYEKAKVEMNSYAMKYFDFAEGLYRKSEERLVTASKLTIVGNILDYGPDVDRNIESTMSTVFSQEFRQEELELFRDALARAQSIAYLADNAGEIVFDKILVKHLLSEGKSVVYYVKGAPWINDATMKDAEDVGMTELCPIREVPVSDGLEVSGPDFLRELGSYDMVIAKGQGNFEALSDVDMNIFFLFLVKCSLVGNEIGLKKGDIALWCKK